MKNIKLYTYCLFGLLAILFTGYQVHIYFLKKSAQHDIDFMHQAFLENHPGVYNDQDPNFVSTMNKAYQEATHAIQSMKSSYDHEIILKEYLKTFQDPHIKFRPKNQQILNLSALQESNEHFSIQHLPHRITWITLPTLEPNKEQQKELEKILNQLPNYQKSNMIVFDLRNNSGGNSIWGTQLLQSLFSEEYLNQQIEKANKKTSSDWRASKDNIAHLGVIIDYMKDQFGEESPIVAEFKEIKTGMQQAYNEHKIFYSSYPTEEDIISTNTVKNPVTAQIIAIISSQCFSSCLIFIDELKIVNPETILIGQTTSADTIYLDMRIIDFPSGIGSFRTPIKIHRGRPRGNNVPYTPNIPYPTNINSEEEKNQWLLETIEKLSIIDSK